MAAEAVKYASIDPWQSTAAIGPMSGGYCGSRRWHPDIVEEIPRGDEPEGMSLDKLRRDLPVVCGEQRGQCGLSS
jgi:hypothetical protein